jgi:hypothetical protein
MTRIDLDHARREADSLQRFFEREGKQDLAEFAAMTRALVDELKMGRPVVEAARSFRGDVDEGWHLEDCTPEYVDEPALCVHGCPQPRLAAALDAYDQHDPPATHDQAELAPRLPEAGPSCL